MINQATRTYQTLTRPPPLPDHIVINKLSELVELIDIPFSTLEKSDKYLLACKNGDHPNSVAKVIMNDKKGKEELDQYTLTRSEYANKIGKSPNAVRMMMRHGKLSGEYRFNGSKYIFKSPERPRENYNNDHPTITKMTTSKKVNRGNHFDASYPNEAFRLYNQNKKEQALLNKIQGKFKSEAHRLEYEKLNEEDLKLSLKNTEKENKNSFSPLKDYGGPVAMRRPSYPSIDPIDDYNSRSPIRQPFRGYDSMGSYDDGSVEIDLSRSGVSHGEPEFKNKIAESIWRLKNKK